MQIFLPYKSFRKSAKTLDYKRLGKQRVEAMQIINVIEGNTRKDGQPYKGWLKHPCVIMWRGFAPALKLYHNIFIEEWIQRGYKNNMALYDLSEIQITYPYWLGEEQFHLSHRANLLRKNNDYYKKYDWNVDSSCGYIWLDKNGNWYEQNVINGEKKFLE